MDGFSSFPHPLLIQPRPGMREIRVRPQAVHPPERKERKERNGTAAGTKP